VILRELFVRLGLSIDEQAFAKGELAAEVVKASLEKLVDIAKETAEKFVEMIRETAEYGKETKEAAQATGLTTEALQQLRGAARAVGLDAGDLDVGIFKLSRTMAAAKKGSEEATAALKKVKFQEGGKLRAADEVLGDIADQFAAMPDGAEKTARAMDIFGRSGARLIPLLNKGRAGIDALRASAVVLTDEQLEAGEELVKTQKQLANMTTKLWRGAIAPLLPAINDLLKRYLAWRKANAEIMRQNIQKYIGYVIKAVTKLADGFSFLLRNAAAIKAMLLTGLVIAFSQVSTAATIAAVRTALAWAAAAAPFVALAALIAGILLVFDDIRVYQQGGKSLYGRFKKEIDDWLKPRDKDPWFVAAIKDFVRLIQQALDLIDEFYKATGRVNPREVDRKAGLKDKEIQRRADVMTQESARRRVQLGLPLTEEEKAALVRTGASPEGFVNKYAPKGPLAPPTPAQLGAQQGPVLYRPETPAPLVLRQGGAAPIINVYPTPGMSEEQVGQIVADKVQEHWDNQMEAAAAAAGP
jgi:hypothetical protein